MSFAVQMSQDLARVEFRDFGEDAIYTPTGGSGQAITAIIDRENTELEYSADGQEFNRIVTVRIMTAEVNTPERGAKMQFPINANVAKGNVAWNIVDTPIVPGDGMAILRCFRRERVERSAEDHRLET